MVQAVGSVLDRAMRLHDDRHAAVALHAVLILHIAGRATGDVAGLICFGGEERNVSIWCGRVQGVKANSSGENGLEAPIPNTNLHMSATLKSTKSRTNCVKEEEQTN